MEIKHIPLIIFNFLIKDYILKLYEKNQKNDGKELNRNYISRPLSNYKRTYYIRPNS